jgi:hypothetical protein
MRRRPLIVVIARAGRYRWRPLSSAAGVEAESGVPPASVSSLAAVAPTAPRAASATPGNKSIELTWLTPGSNGGAAIDRYEVRRSTVLLSAATGWSRGLTSDVSTRRRSRSRDGRLAP